MKCKTCGTEIATTATGGLEQLITCPACETVSYAAGDGTGPAPFTPSRRSLPAKMSIEVVDGQLVITRHWRGVVPLVLLGIVSFMLTFGLFFSDVPTPMFLFNPLTWIIAGMGYYSLSAMVNTTVMRVDRARLTVKEGPLLPRRRREIASGDIAQLYAKQHVQTGNKRSTTSYQLHLVREDGEHLEIVSDLENPEQALFLEQEIERFLGLADRAVPGEHLADLPGNFAGWRIFAAANGLRYDDGKLLARQQVHGLFQGYRVELVVVQPRLAFGPHTRLTLTTADGKGPDQSLADQMTLEMVAALFAAPVQSASPVMGQINVADGGKTLIYEETEVVTEAAYLQGVFDTLVRLGQAYLRIVALGGAVMPVLHPIALDQQHPARVAAAQLMKDVAPTTEYLAPAEKTSLLLCPDCLVRSAVHKLELGGLTTVSYYGCRQCHQSKTFLNSETVVAVLDRRTGPEPVQQGRTLTANWLARRTLFDFDTVHIIDAADEEVERFAVQVGNDTDPVRKSRYRQLRCTVSPARQLSENSFRILRRMFGQVEIEDITGTGGTNVEAS